MRPATGDQAPAVAAHGQAGAATAGASYRVGRRGRFALACGRQV